MADSKNTLDGVNWDLNELGYSAGAAKQLLVDAATCDNGAPGAIRDGAEAFKKLLSLVGLVAEESSLAASESGDFEDDDPADHKLMFDLVSRSVVDNVGRATEDHREGYLRALTYLLMIVAEGGVPGERWDPIRGTERAFSAARVAACAGQGR